MSTKDSQVSSRGSSQDTSGTSHYTTNITPKAPFFPETDTSAAKDTPAASRPPLEGVSRFKGKRKRARRGTNWIDDWYDDVQREKAAKAAIGNRTFDNNGSEPKGENDGQRASDSDFDESVSPERKRE
jgi:hypothetical protein